MIGGSYASLSEAIDDGSRPWLDRRDLDDAGLSDQQRSWRDRGVLVLPGFIPDELIDRYVKRFVAYHDVGGFATPTPYEHIEEARALALYAPLRAVIDDLIRDEMVLHLTLTPWISTQRAWHQDDYLNGPEVNGWYLATWIALDDIAPESGPFEFVPGSHRWPVLRRDRVMALMTDEESRQDSMSPQGMWTIYTQDAVAAAVEERRIAEGLPVEQFLGRRGDVLIWHACLQHRGAIPQIRARDRWRPLRAKLPLRKAFISHYTAASHLECDPGAVVEYERGGRWVAHRLPIDHLLGPQAGKLAHRARKNIEWVARRR